MRGGGGGVVDGDGGGTEANTSGHLQWRIVTFNEGAAAGAPLHFHHGRYQNVGVKL